MFIFALCRHQNIIDKTQQNFSWEGTKWIPNGIIVMIGIDGKLYKFLTK